MAMQVAPGDFSGTIVDHKIGSAGTGNKQLVFTCNVTHELDEEGNKIALNTPLTRTVFRTITGNTVNRLVQELRLLGYQGNGFSQLDKESCDAQDFIDLSGTEVELRCSENNYKGNQNERWDFRFEGLSQGVNVQRAAAEEVRALDAEFADMFSSIPAAPKADPAKNTKPAAAAAKPAANGKPKNGTKKETVPF